MRNVKLTLLGVLLIGLIELNYGQNNPSEDAMAMSKTMSMIKDMQKKSIGNPDPMVGIMVAEMKSNDKRNPDEMGTYMDGDILQTQKYNREGVKPMWTGGIVYYTVAGDFNNEEKIFIAEAMNEIESKTCIKFKPYTRKQRDYIAITSKNTGCWSAIGRTSRRQDLNLQRPGCVRNRGVPIHELLHALGFPHEHTRIDRDDYVRIRTSNIVPSNLHNFKRIKFSGLGVKYDYDSVMHYGKFAFTKNNEQTIFPRRADASIGQRSHLSKSDAEEINRLYHCPQSTIASSRSKSSIANRGRSG